MIANIFKICILKINKNKLNVASALQNISGNMEGLTYDVAIETEETLDEGLLELRDHSSSAICDQCGKGKYCGFFRLTRCS